MFVIIYRKEPFLEKERCPGTGFQRIEPGWG
jgi:hypothetical protein